MSHVTLVERGRSQTRCASDCCTPSPTTSYPSGTWHMPSHSAATPIDTRCSRRLRFLSMKHLPLLGDLEMAVLERIWRCGELDVKQAHRAIGVPRKITLNTVQSTLERLYRKGLLRRERVSHAYRYAPTFSREQFRAKAVADVAGELSGVEGADVLTAFVELAADADRENLDRLEQVIIAARAKRGLP